jgi:Zn-dependent peptidase ImmA (M78 family)/DNA-binding XRE family transcriptional regulator
MLRVRRTEEGFVGERLKLARTFRGLTQTELGEQVSLSVGRVSLIEQGKATPQELLVEAFAEVTGFEPGFFFVGLEEQLTEEACSFRRLRSAPKREKERMLARGTLLVLLMRYLRSRQELTLPGYNVPAIPATSIEEAERAAVAARRWWNIDPAAPIDRVGRVIENAGVVWVIVDAGTKKVDAFSYPGEVSIIFANAAKQSTSRTVFNLAHELGHLVMHGDTDAGLPEREEQANRFASAFLLPADGFGREFPRSGFIEWEQFFALKRRWKTSVAAIIRRAYDLKLIGPAQYLRGYKYLHAKGWHRGEPAEPEAETPEVVGLALSSLRDELGEEPRAVANALAWRKETLEEVTGLQLPDGNTVDITEIYKAAGAKRAPGKGNHNGEEPTEG